MDSHTNLHVPSELLFVLALFVSLIQIFPHCLLTGLLKVFLLAQPLRYCGKINL